MHRLIFAAVLVCAALIPLPAFAQAVPYDFEPAYNPNYVIDTFSNQGGTVARREGGKLVRLPNGDIVVAGRMRLVNDTLGEFFNIGLVRYNKNGLRVAWSGTTGPYFHADRQYVIFPNLPNGGSGDAKIESVDDIAYADGKIYLLVTRQFQASPLDRDIEVYVFNEDGTFVQNAGAIGSSVDEIGKALDVTVTNILVKPVVVTVLAERNFQRMVVAQLAANSSGIISLDATFGSGGSTQVAVPTVLCNNASICNVMPADIARPFRAFNANAAPIYIAGAVQRGGTDWDFLAVKLDSDGAPDTSFGFSGAQAPTFDRPGGDNGDYGTALVVDGSSFIATDTLWIVGNVSQSCKTGIGFVKLDGNGTIDNAFGAFGRIVHGGSTAVGILCNIAFNDYAADVTLQGSDIAVAAGGRRFDSASGETIYNGVTVIANRTTGEFRSRDTHTFIAFGERAGNSTLKGIVPKGNGRYAVSGEGNGLGVFSLYMTAVVRPADTIFSDGVDP